MKIDDAIDYATQTAADLQAAHEKEHHTPGYQKREHHGNRQSQIKIMDFGLALAKVSPGKKDY